MSTKQIRRTWGYSLRGSHQKYLIKLIKILSLSLGFLPFFSPSGVVLTYSTSSALASLAFFSAFLLGPLN